MFVKFGQSDKEPQMEETGQTKNIKLSSVCSDEEMYIETVRNHPKYSIPLVENEKAILLFDNRTPEVINYIKKSYETGNGICSINNLGMDENRIGHGSEEKIWPLLGLFVNKSR